MTGNVIVIAQPDRYASLNLKQFGEMNVTGSIVQISDPTPDSNTHLQTFVYGTLNLNGVFSMLGPNVQTMFYDTCDANITGALQIGSPTVGEVDDFLFKIDGNLEIHKDNAALAQGAEALRNLNTSMGLTQAGEIFFSGLGGNLTSLSWSPHEYEYE